LITERVQRVLSAWAAEEGWSELPQVRLERPIEEAHGDYATPVCMQMAKMVRRSPVILAQELGRRLREDPGLSALIEKVEVAGPGFINLTLSARAYAEAMSEMLALGDEIGRQPTRPHPRVNLEFVSVNPNGPLHAGHGRYAAYGDALHRLLAFTGVNVETEFYINDYGRQMDRFGRSVAARYAQSFEVDLPVPADGYQGAYVNDIAAAAREEVGDRYLAALQLVATAASACAVATTPAAVAGGAPGDAAAAGENFDDEGSEGSSEWPDVPIVADAIAFFRVFGCRSALDGMREELEHFGVSFDCWFSETTLHQSGRLRQVVDRLLGAGEAYEEGGAIWLRTTSRGDDKDRVLIRGNGHPTYFAADIAYHEDKLERGFDHLINIWGADHHGYVPRMTAAVEILSGRAGALEVIIGQLVNLMEKGELRQMSTRRGEMVTLAEVIEAIGVDAARFFLVSRSQDQTLDLDIDLAQRQSADNPVFYVQYAHARIASIVRNAPEGTHAEVLTAPGVFESAYERSLIKRLESFSELLQDAAERRGPHRIAGYAQELAADFHVFYKHCRVLGVEPALGSSRLALCLVVRRVIFRCLDLLGVSAPESM
jgi:arginyl-tRNA synthetase